MCELLCCFLMLHMLDLLGSKMAYIMLVFD